MKSKSLSGQPLITSYFKRNPVNMKAKTGTRLVRQMLISTFFYKKSLTEYGYDPKLYHQVRKFRLGDTFYGSADRVDVREGFLYVATNNYSNYTIINAIKRRIIINGIPIELEAGASIGEAEVDDDSALTHISIEPAFQRQGFGTKLIKFINKCCGQFIVYTGTGHNSRYRLTEEGAQLIRKCERTGILDSDQVIQGTVPCSPVHGFD